VRIHWVVRVTVHGRSLGIFTINHRLRASSALWLIVLELVDPCEGYVGVYIIHDGCPLIVVDVMNLSLKADGPPFQSSVGIIEEAINRPSIDQARVFGQAVTNSEVVGLGMQFDPGG